jgi:hypothetical protein
MLMPQPSFESHMFLVFNFESVISEMPIADTTILEVFLTAILRRGRRND